MRKRLKEENELEQQHICLIAGEGNIFSKAGVWWKELLMLDQTDLDTKKNPGPSTGSGIRSQLNK